MTTPTVTMHPAPPDNRPPPPERIERFVVLYAFWHEFVWYTTCEIRTSMDSALIFAQGARERGHIVYGIAEITATRQEPPHA